jgi:hypothetical protein
MSTGVTQQRVCLFTLCRWLLDVLTRCLTCCFAEALCDPWILVGSEPWTAGYVAGELAQMDDSAVAVPSNYSDAAAWCDYRRISGAWRDV